MGWLAVVVGTYGTILTVPTVYSSYEQCMYHAEQIEEQRRWIMDSVPIKVKCVVETTE